MNSLVTTLSDCGILTIGVLLLVATDVLLAKYPTVPVRASCDVAKGFGSAGVVSGRRAVCVRRLRAALRVRDAGEGARRLTSGAVTVTGGSEAPLGVDCA